MTKAAFLFTGQGIQELGMTSDLYEKYPIVRETLEQVNSILGYDICELIDNEEDKLNQTRYTQPAILTTSVTIFRLLQEKGYRPDVVASLSLGEYSALVASGVLSFEDAVALVAKCGEFMETAAPAGTGKIVAVMNTEASLIEEICQKVSSKGIVTPTNYSTPAQIVIDGEVEAVNCAVELLKKADAKHLIPLRISGPFHTALLQSASERLAEALDKVTFSEFRVPLTGNTEAKITDHADIKALLTRQVKGPIRFCDSIKTMCELGMTEAIEIDPGKVLNGFLRKIDKAILASTVEDEASPGALLEK